MGLLCLVYVFCSKKISFWAFQRVEDFVMKVWRSVFRIQCSITGVVNK